MAPPTRDLGSIDWAMGGNGLYGSWVDVNETIPDLTWPLSVQMYGRMRRDPRLTAILNAYCLPIRRATWVVDPSGCRDEVVQMVADDLGLPILGADTTPGPARRRGVSWGEHIRLALLSLVYGHACFERRYEIRNGQARLVNLGERPPWTISSFELNTDGTIRSVVQNHAGASPITANRLVWYAHEREGAAWAGQSVLRPAYAPWLLKHELWRVHATTIRRFGMGVPSVTAPTGATPGQVLQAQQLASATRVGDQSGVGLPPGFEFKLTGLTGSVPDAMAAIHYFDQQMSTMALAGFLDLGQTATGSRALGESFVDLFMLSLQAVADEIANTATSGQPGLNGIVTDIVDLNWGEDEPAPRVRCLDVGDNHELTVEAIDGLISSGAITPDNQLEAYLRSTYRLPERLPAPAPAPAPQPPAVAATTTKRRRAAKAREVRAAGDPAAGHRQLTTIEAASGMDPDAIQEDWTTALDTLIEEWTDIAAAQRASLVVQIATAVAAGALIDLGQLVIDAAAGAAKLAAAMIAAAVTSVSRMIGEAKSQGIKIPAVAPDEDWLTEVADTIAETMARSTAATAGREALRVATPGRNGDEVATLVDDYLTGLSDSWLRDNLGGALTLSQNHGRLAAVDAAPSMPTMIATEVLDKNTCQACLDIDGHEFESIDAAREAYSTGGYTECLGRLRCRGILIANWKD